MAAVIEPRRGGSAVVAAGFGAARPGVVAGRAGPAAPLPRGGGGDGAAAPRREEEEGAVVAPSGGRPHVSQNPSSTVPRHEGHLQFAPLIVLSFLTAIFRPMPGLGRHLLSNCYPKLLGTHERRALRPNDPIADALV
jgi:hypothetical protein